MVFFAVFIPPDASVGGEARDFGGTQHPVDVGPTGRRHQLCRGCVIDLDRAFRHRTVGDLKFLEADQRYRSPGSSLAQPKMNMGGPPAAADGSGSRLPGWHKPERMDVVGSYYKPCEIGCVAEGRMIRYRIVTAI